MATVVFRTPDVANLRRSTTTGNRAVLVYIDIPYTRNCISVNLTRIGEPSAQTVLSIFVVGCKAGLKAVEIVNRKMCEVNLTACHQPSARQGGKSVGQLVVRP